MANFELVYLAPFVAWTILASLFCYRATDNFRQGFPLSLLIATAPPLAILICSQTAVKVLQIYILLTAIALPLTLVVGILVTRQQPYYKPPTDRTHCPNCEYNLTGNTSGRCPECGLQLENPEDGHP